MAPAPRTSSHGDRRGLLRALGHLPSPGRRRRPRPLRPGHGGPRAAAARAARRARAQRRYWRRLGQDRGAPSGRRRVAERRAAEGPRARDGGRGHGRRAAIIKRHGGALGRRRASSCAHRGDGGGPGFVVRARGDHRLRPGRRVAGDARALRGPRRGRRRRKRRGRGNRARRAGADRRGERRQPARAERAVSGGRGRRRRRARRRRRGLPVGLRGGPAAAAAHDDRGPINCERGRFI